MCLNITTRCSPTVFVNVFAVVFVIVFVCVLLYLKITAAQFFSVKRKPMSTPSSPTRDRKVLYPSENCIYKVIFELYFQEIEIVLVQRTLITPEQFVHIKKTF